MLHHRTGGGAGVGEVFAKREGKLDGSARLVPAPNVAIVDLTFATKRDTSVEEINSLLKAASESGPLKGVLADTDEPLVSIDFNHWPASSTVDSLETAVIDGKQIGRAHV